MGWAYCGVDEDGRPIGYAVEAVCDHPECEEEIDRGLAYCCGGMHGGEAVQGEDGSFVTTCGRYFCPEHLGWVDVGEGHEVCEACRKEIERELGGGSR